MPDQLPSLMRAQTRRLRVCAEFQGWADGLCAAGEEEAVVGAQRSESSSQMKPSS